MQVVGYSPDELKHRIINDILIEAQTRRPEFSTDEVVQRACGQTDHGERDRATPRNAVLRKAA